MKPIEIFRAGTHTAMSGRKVTITTAELKDCAAAYDRQLQEAPLVVGHPQTDAPAYGWVAGLKVEGDVLVADPDQVNPQFAAMVQNGAFKKRSVSFYGPTDQQNPTPGKYYVKHVGFLGATAPAVQGLKEVQFAASDDAIEFADWQGLAVAKLLGNIRDFFIGQFGQEKADAVLPADAIDQIKFDAAQPDCSDDDDGAPSFSQPGDTMKTEAQLAAERAQLDQDKIQFAEDRRVLRVGNITTFVEGLIAAGKLPTGHKDPVIAFMATLPEGDSATFEFAKADGVKSKTDATAWFKAFLTELPQLVPTGEHAQHRQGEEFAQGKPILDADVIYGVHNRTAK